MTKIFRQLKRNKKLHAVSLAVAWTGWYGIDRTAAHRRDLDSGPASLWGIYGEEGEVWQGEESGENYAELSKYILQHFTR